MKLQCSVVRKRALVWSTYVRVCVRSPSGSTRWTRRSRRTTSGRTCGVWAWRWSRSPAARTPTRAGARPSSSSSRWCRSRRPGCPPTASPPSSSASSTPGAPALRFRLYYEQTPVWTRAKTARKTLASLEKEWKKRPRFADLLQHEFVLANSDRRQETAAFYERLSPPTPLAPGQFGAAPSPPSTSGNSSADSDKLRDAPLSWPRVSLSAPLLVLYEHDPCVLTY